MTSKTLKRPQLTGAEKTAVLMNILGEDTSFQLMRDLKDKDVRQLLTIMSQMKKAPVVMINLVLAEFLTKLSERDEVFFDDALTRPEAVTKGLGEERAKQIFGDLKKNRTWTRKQLTALEGIEPKALAEFLMDEHPQTVAIVVAHLEPVRQGTVIKSLPEGVRAEVVLRMANLNSLGNDRVEELDVVLKNELGAGKKGENERIGGVLTVAEIVNALDKRTMNSLMAKIEDKDPILAEEIRQHMFTFTDLIKIDDRGIQMILREVPNDRLLLALKSAPEELREKIYGCMSERAADILREDLGALGPQKVSDVEAAQREVVTIVKRLEEEGKIVIGVGGEDSEIVP
ncbi:MAG: flagellar motor switch protein FliG [Deltaproteobacteria bacterium]|nr:flagellar motor switch protein FliG [Deltaproteobacteria bacterium]MBI3295203.1 flagellar motor switch protein FliG [Deltaproteobacteria bacterium]